MQVAAFIVSLILTLGYAVVIAAWCSNWYKHRDNSGIPLHYYFGFTLFLQFLVMIFITAFYGSAHHELAIAIVADVLSYIAEGIFYSLLILIAIGWCIVRAVITKGYRFNIGVFVSIYVALEILSLFVGGFLIVVIALLVIVMYFAMMYYVFSFTQANIKQLISEIDSEAVLAANSATLATSSQSSNPPTADGVAYPPSSNPYPFPPDSTQSYPTAPPASEMVHVSLNDDAPPKSVPSHPPTSTIPSHPETPTVYVDRTPATSSVHERIPEAQEKLKLFRVFFKLMLTYIIVIIILTFFPVFSTDAVYAVFFFLRLYFIFFFLTGLCWVFRLRPLNQYFYLVLNDQA